MVPDLWMKRESKTVLDLYMRKERKKPTRFVHEEGKKNRVKFVVHRAVEFVHENGNNKSSSICAWRGKLKQQIEQNL